MEDLIKRYQGNTELLDKISKYSNEKLTSLHPKYEVGQIISFIGGYDSDINYITTIIGFDDEYIFVYWDCYWFPIRDEEKRNIKILTDKELTNIRLKRAAELRNIKLINEALDELSEIYE